MASPLQGFRQFLWAAIKNPKSVSTLFPTMSYLSQALVSEAEITSETTVLELGSGSGAITSHILNKKPKHLIGIELDASLVAFLKKHFSPGEFHQASASDLSQCVEDQSVDVVISSLPWTLFNQKTQEAITKEILRVLRPGGRFVSFICLHSLAYPGANRAKRLFAVEFHQFDKKQRVLRNMPPAQIYVATKAR